MRHSGMTMKVTAWVIGLALAATSTACGADSDGAASGRSVSSSPPSSGSSTLAPDPPLEAVRPTTVSVVRGGGIRPTRVSLRFAEGEPPPDGYTSADTTAVLAAADDPALRSTTQPTIGSTCCDQYVYVVTIDWSDGVTTQLDAVQGAIQPPALARVISRAESPS